eukprot:2986651-Prymnesium_polylepis.2
MLPNGAPGAPGAPSLGIASLVSARVSLRMFAVGVSASVWGVHRYSCTVARPRSTSPIFPMPPVGSVTHSPGRTSLGVPLASCASERGTSLQMLTYVTRRRSGLRFVNCAGVMRALLRVSRTSARVRSPLAAHALASLSVASVLRAPPVRRRVWWKRRVFRAASTDVCGCGSFPRGFSQVRSAGSCPHARNARRHVSVIVPTGASTMC